MPRFRRLFNTKEEAVMFFCEKNIQDKKPHKVTRSTKDRFSASCKVDGCQYNVSVRRRLDGLFHVVSFHKHTCDSLFPTIKASWVKKLAKDTLAGTPKIGTKKLKESLHAEHGVVVQTWTVQRGLTQARQSLAKDAEEYGKLRPLFAQLTHTDERTVTDVLLDGDCLKRSFLCLGMCVSAFGHSLKVLGVDGCHLKTQNGGVVLVATAIDGNGNIFPVAVGTAEQECVAAWTWFLQRVRTALQIGNGDGVVVLSDMEKGIDNAVASQLPQASHGLCLFHIEKNFVKRFHTNFNGILWKAARATTPEGFNSYINNLRSISPESAQYILSKHPEKWARAFFNGRRFGHLTSNVAESANAFISDLRTLHPTHFFAGFIRKVNALFLERRSLHAKLRPDALPEKPAALVKKAIDQCRTLRVIQHSETLFEVQRMTSRNEFRSVDVGALRCSCGFPQEEALPCRHICAACLFKTVDPRTLVIPERRAGALQALYVGSTVPVDLTLLENDGTRAPAYKQGRGRPKTKRIRSVIEAGRKRPVVCRRCGGSGHNARTCNNDD